MKEREFKILENRPLAKDVYLLKMDGDCSAIQRPGQFVEVEIPGKYLRRPISVCDVEGDQLTLIYKVLGQGTELLSYKEEGEYLSLLSGLGNGYDLAKVPDHPVLCGGGVGVPPLYYLCKKLVQEKSILMWPWAFEVRKMFSLRRSSVLYPFPSTSLQKTAPTAPRVL